MFFFTESERKNDYRTILVPAFKKSYRNFVKTPTIHLLIQLIEKPKSKSNYFESAII